MDDDLLSRIKHLFAPSINPKSQQLAERTLNSPAADTLWQISGGGKPFRSASRLSSLPISVMGALAGYNPIFDKIVFNPSHSHLSDLDPNVSAYNALNAMSHEAGHRADFKRSDAPGKNAPFKLPDVDLPLPPKNNAVASSEMVQVSPKEWRLEVPTSKDPYARQRDLINVARSKVDQYYQKSPREGYAQAFAAAMDVMRGTPSFLAQGHTRDEYAQELAKAEAITPGTGGIVEALLKEPVYKNHPLQRIYKRK